MKNKRYIFVGNRRFVLEEVVKQGLNLVSVIIAAGTHLEKDYERGIIICPSVNVVNNKIELINLLKSLNFDVMISNGCPYILPIHELPKAKYINIHPSCLPDLRGVDPVIGAILYGRDAGATCHIMDAGIDTGDIISQVRIPYSTDLDVTTLYQLSFIAEKKVLLQALKKGFAGDKRQIDNKSDIYYSRKLSDRIITFLEDNDFMLRKIKAFNNKSQGCEFYVKDRKYLVYSATKMENKFLISFLKQFDEGVIGLSYEGSVIFMKDGEAIRFNNITSEHDETLPCGTKLF